MAPDMKVIGRRTFSMALEKRSGLITANMRVNILKAKSMAEGSTSGQMEACMKEIGSIIV